MLFHSLYIDNLSRWVCFDNSIRHVANWTIIEIKLAKHLKYILAAPMRMGLARSATYHNTPMHINPCWLTTNLIMSLNAFLPALLRPNGVSSFPQSCISFANIAPAKLSPHFPIPCILLAQSLHHQTVSILVYNVSPFLQAISFVWWEVEGDEGTDTIRFWLYNAIAL